MMTVTLEDVRRDFLTETCDDYVGLWSLIWQVRERMRESDPERRREITMAIVSDLLHSDMIKAGMLDFTGGFEQWKDGPASIIERIAKEWSQLGREPDIGEVAWFTSTD